MKLTRKLSLIFLLSLIGGCAGAGPGQGGHRLAIESKEEAGFWHQTFGSKSGVDPRARQIEKSLGL